MDHRIRPELQFLDPHLRDDLGPMPAWGLTQQGKLDKYGKQRLAWVWPRDKGIHNSPLSSWTRWKDVLTKKGPGVWISREGSLSPNRPLWSRWMDEDEFGQLDNLGYRNDQCEIGLSSLDPNVRYDFKSRKYEKAHTGMWSDAKWERGRNPKRPLYYRDAVGVERYDWDGVWPADNPFAYNRDHPNRETPYLDWARPGSNSYYYGVYRPEATMQL